MQKINNYEETYKYLLKKYGRMVLVKKEMAQELGVSMGTLSNYMRNRMGCPTYKKIGKAKNSRVTFHISEVARFLSENQILTM